MKKYFLVIMLLIGAYQFINNPENLSAREIDPSCDIVVFTTPTCPYCKKARNFLNKEKVTWCERDIQNNSKNRDLYFDLGGKGVPFAVFGNTKVHGYNSVSYKNASSQI